MNRKTSISNVIHAYINVVASARSANTARTYQNAMHAFCEMLREHGLPPESTPISALTDEAIPWFIATLKVYSPATERLYLTAMTGFYEYLCAERLCEINLPRVRLLIRQRARKPGQRLPQFPYNNIEIIIKYANKIASMEGNDPLLHLISLRDRAFLLTLADTGLRVHEACGLRRGDVDWNEGRAIIIGKGNQQAVVRFSKRSLGAIRDYLSARAELDGGSGRTLASLPLFARHDRGAGRKVKPITTTTGRNIVTQRVIQALGSDAAGSITPHSFRHYFVTVVLRASGNLKLAQELARHKNIAVTQRYAHLADDELDKGYYEIFEQKRAI
ncbi:MAG: tyrosine-type recombinase/integrase [Acidobacteriaceae bacterium]